MLTQPPKGSFGSQIWRMNESFLVISTLLNLQCGLAENSYMALVIYKTWSDKTWSNVMLNCYLKNPPACKLGKILIP